LDANRFEREDCAWEPRQAFYTGLKKPRELIDDARLYRAYRPTEERLCDQGGRVRRVVLDYELKRDYQRFRYERKRGRKDSDGRPDRQPGERARWAREHEAPYDDWHVRSRMPLSSTKTVTVARGMRISISSPATTAASTPGAPRNQASPAISPSDARSAVAEALGGEPRTRGSRRR
jgi:hypothetical protein